MDQLIDRINKGEYGLYELECILRAIQNRKRKDRLLQLFATMPDDERTSMLEELKKLPASYDMQEAREEARAMKRKMM